MANSDKKTFIDDIEQFYISKYDSVYGNCNDMFNESHTLQRRLIRKCNSIEDLLNLRELIRNYGIDNVKNDLKKLDILNEDCTISTNKNIFAKFISGEIKPFYGDDHENDEFFLAKNLPENDKHVHDTSKEWLGKASMSETHLFIVPRDLSDWTLVNGLTLGLENPVAALDMLIKMKKYGSTKVPNGHTPGFFLHIMPFNSIQLLHLHVIDMNTIGPSFEELSFKNLPLDAMMAVLEMEIKTKL